MHRMLDRASCCVGYNGACASGNQVTPVAFTGIQHLFVTIATIQERSMMLRIDWKKLHSYALAGALMGAASLVVVPHGAAHAQTAASRGSRLRQVKCLVTEVKSVMRARVFSGTLAGCCIC